MAQEIEKLYEDAIASGIVPGASLIAGDKDGNVLYTKSFGKASLKEGLDRPMTDSTICILASMTKLMTSVAVLQCVEDGKLDLDQDVKPLLPEVGKYGIITGFDDEKNVAILSPNETPITLRMLLSHTSGHEYDWVGPNLTKWKASRGETMWQGSTVEEKSAIPLIFEPGTAFAYGGGHDWAGRAIEKAVGSTLEDYMRARIWTPLGVQDDFSFWPDDKDGMKDRLATLSMFGESGAPPVVDASFIDTRLGATACMGGGPCFGSPRAYYTLLSAILRRDARLLKATSYEELFRPQLDERCEQSLNDYIVSSPVHTQLVGLLMPPARVTWSFAGMVPKEEVEGRCSSDAVMWAGATTCQWFIDTKAGVCGTAISQMFPPLYPPVMELHKKFQGFIYEKYGRKE